MGVAVFRTIEPGMYVHSYVAHTPETETQRYQAVSQHFSIIKMDTFVIKDKANKRIGKELKIIADMHVHSTFSVDGRDDLMGMCQAAIEKGLGYICFTEHFDMNPKDYGYGYFNFEEFSKAVDSARSQFADRLCILKGLEFNEPHLYPVEFEDVLKKDFDVVLGAVHWLGEFLISDKELQERFNKEEIFEKYYTEVLKTTKFGGFDILAHLDSPKRYLKQPYNERSLIDEILGELAEAGIALEINTLPLRKGLNECSPDKDLLERYVEHKGSRVCIGSDAHSSPDIGAGFEYAQGLVRRNNKLGIGIFLKDEFLSINLANIPGVD